MPPQLSIFRRPCKYNPMKFANFVSFVLRTKNRGNGINFLCVTQKDKQNLQNSHGGYIFFTFYNISQPNFAILLSLLRCSLMLCSNEFYCFDIFQNFAIGPLYRSIMQSVHCIPLTILVGCGCSNCMQLYATLYTLTVKMF